MGKYQSINILFTEIEMQVTTKYTLKITIIHNRRNVNSESNEISPIILILARIKKVTPTIGKGVRNSHFHTLYERSI